MPKRGARLKKESKKENKTEKSFNPIGFFPINSAVNIFYQNLIKVPN